MLRQDCSFLTHLLISAPYYGTAIWQQNKFLTSPGEMHEIVSLLLTWHCSMEYQSLFLKFVDSVQGFVFFP